MNNKKVMAITILIIVLITTVTATALFIKRYNEVKNEDEQQVDLDEAQKELPRIKKEEKTEEVIDENASVEEKYNAFNMQDNVQINKTFKDEVRDGENYIWAAPMEIIGRLLQEKKPTNISSKILEMYLDNLSFNIESLNEDTYVSYVGEFTQEKKDELINYVKEKLKTSPDLLESLSPSDEILYTILYKNLEFKEPFMNLTEEETVWNGKNIRNLKYFGFDSDKIRNANNLSQNMIKNMLEQVEVIYYNSEEDFAFKITDKTGNDELIFIKEEKRTEIENKDAQDNKRYTFEDKYNKLVEKINIDKYQGRTQLESKDLLKIPKLDINVKKEHNELENISFIDKTGTNWRISKAIQQIQFKLNEQGAELKAEAAMELRNTVMANSDIMSLVLDRDFTLFMKEKGEDKQPYFALQVTDIESVRER